MNVVIIFVFLLNTFEDSNSFFHCWFINLDRLHASFEGSIFFNDAVFIESSSTNKLKFATSKGRFEDVSGIHITVSSRTSTYNFMNFVDKEDNILTFPDFLHEFLHAFFELTTNTSTLDKAHHIQTDNFFALEFMRHIPINYFLC